VKKSLLVRLASGATLSMALAFPGAGFLSAQPSALRGEQLSAPAPLALDWKAVLESEDTFLAALGDRAVFVAPGVYEVTLGPSESARVAFGDEGRQFDRERFEARLAAAQDELARTANPSRNLLRKVHRLEDLVAALQTPSAKAAVTGTISDGVENYDWSLDGGISGGMVTGKASIAIYIDWNIASGFRNRYADTYASVFRSVSCLETTVSASDARTDGLLGAASATASVSCTGNCKAWETFSEVTLGGWSDGYRSLTRWGGLPICL